MEQKSSPSYLDTYFAEHARLVETLCTEAGCERWGLSREGFAETLRRSTEKRFGIRAASGESSPVLETSSAEIESYLKSLHLEDLALACACNAGIESAWDFFVAEFRSDLRNAARAILRGSGSAGDASADELADSLYAELYGIRSDTDGQRKSLFAYFHGRSKLSTWLRTVLAQRHVDVLRSGARTVSLDAEPEADAPNTTTEPHYSSSLDPQREQYLRRIDRALSNALANLTPRERMILSCYYVDNLTLAQISRMTSEHESTISRQLDRVRRTLRESVIQQLKGGTSSQGGTVTELPLDKAQVELAFEYAVEDWSFDLSRLLSKNQSGGEPNET